MGVPFKNGDGSLKGIKKQGNEKLIVECNLYSPLVHRGWGKMHI